MTLLFIALLSVTHQSDLEYFLCSFGFLLMLQDHGTELN